ncbi:hypothetical protein BGZ83_011692 [Gryganskiella cystojenkinii]|nr:hypothetical protein BGZ83_011692 [Gryganskiella cystojenkinii]
MIFLRKDDPNRTILVVKVIPRSELCHFMQTPEELQDTMSPEDFAIYNTFFDRTDKKMVQPLLREISILEQLNTHPHILKYIDHFWTSTKLHIVTELAAGSDLEKRFRHRLSSGRGFYTESELIPMVRILCKTVGYIHEKGWVHRDLKPSNILFRTQADDDLVIADFGFAAMFENSRSDLTSTDIGTPRFRAPEQLRREGHGKPVDMWALGVTCYYLLTSSFPVHASMTDPSSEFMILQTDIDNINWEGVSLNAKEFLQKLMRFNAEERMTAKEASDHAWLAENREP